MSGISSIGCPSLRRNLFEELRASDLEHRGCGQRRIHVRHGRANGAAMCAKDAPMCAEDVAMCAKDAAM